MATDANFKVEVAEQPGPVVVLRTNGYVNDVGGEKISHIVDEYLQQGRKKYVLNLDKSNVVNSIGISILIEVIEKLEEEGGTIAFCHLTNTIAKTFNIMGLTQFAKIYPDETGAVADLATT